MTSRDKSWLESALRSASKHDSGGRYSMVSLLVKGGKLVSFGKNSYLNPGRLKDPMYEYHGIHAELDALLEYLKRGGRGKGKVTMYVAGMSKTGNQLRTTKPCEVCQALIKKSGVISKVVFYEKGEVNEYEVV